LLTQLSSHAALNSSVPDAGKTLPSCEAGEMLVRVTDRRHTARGTLLTLADPHGRVVVAELLLSKRELAAYGSYQRGALVCYPG
jgi:hypothetical protein